MKKIYIFLLTITIILGLTACGNSLSISDNSKTTSSIPYSGTTRPESELSMDESGEFFRQERNQKQEIILKRDSTDSYKSLLTHTYNEEQVFRKPLTGLRFYNPTYGYQQWMYILEEEMPVELLRRTSEETAYTIYQTSEGGLFYAFFIDEYGYWTYSHGAYMKKALTKSDFDFVKEGTSAVEVQKVDPIINVYLSCYEDAEEPVSYHLLKDGILCIRYTRSESDLTVQSMEFGEDFVLASPIQTEPPLTYDFRILPQDYIG